MLLGKGGAMKGRLFSFERFFLQIIVGFLVLGAVLFMAGRGHTKDGSWLKILDPAARFQALANFNNLAVLDRETGLVWEWCPSGNDAQFIALRVCYNRIVGDRGGFRLPTVEELNSLGDGNPGTPPFLPNSTPFCDMSFGANTYFWTSTMAGTTTDAFVVNANSAGDVTSSDIAISRRFWCVRGGAGHD